MIELVSTNHDVVDYSNSTTKQFCIIKQSILQMPSVMQHQAMNDINSKGGDKLQLLFWIFQS